MQSYFARCIRGLEDFCEEELLSLEGLRIEKREIRSLFFSYEGDSQKLLHLQSLDDVFLYLGKIEGLDHTRNSLKKIEDAFPKLALDFPSSIQKIKDIRGSEEQPDFTLTVGLQGKKNFSRFELQDRLLPFFTSHLSANYIPNEPGSPGAALDFRLSLESDTLYIGLRLGKKPLHRRTYKLHSRPGSTKAPLAYVLGSLAGIKPGDKVLDPCCGVGTILIEAAKAFPQAHYFGTDIDSFSIASSREHAESLGMNIDLQLADAQALPFKDQSFDHLISNPPWGRQVAEGIDIPLLYQNLFSELSRVLKKGAQLVLLTDQSTWMNEKLEKSAEFHEIGRRELSLFGSIVRIYHWEKG